MNKTQCRNATHVKIWTVYMFDDRDPMFTQHRLDALKYALKILVKTPQGVEPRRFGKVDDDSGDLIRVSGQRIIVIAHCVGCVYSFLTKVHLGMGYMIDRVLIPPTEPGHGVPLA